MKSFKKFNFIIIFTDQSRKWIEKSHFDELEWRCEALKGLHSAFWLVTWTDPAAVIGPSMAGGPGRPQVLAALQRAAAGGHLPPQGHHRVGGGRGVLQVQPVRQEPQSECKKELVLLAIDPPCGNSNPCKIHLFPKPSLYIAITFEPIMHFGSNLSKFQLHIIDGVGKKIGGRSGPN